MNGKKLTILASGAVLAGALALSAGAAELFLTDVTAPRAEKTPVIDGVFDAEEGWGDPIVHLDSADMKSFAETDPGFENLLDDPAMMITNLDVYMRWDDTSFYYCANVTDPEHFNPEMDAAIWRGDSIIFHVVSVPNDDTRARILFGMDNDGETWAYQETMEDGTLDVSGINDWKVTRNADTKVTTYEAVFKWEDIIPSEKLGAGESFYLRDLFLLANAAYPEPVVAVVPEGYTNGTRNYYKITLSENGAASAPAASADYVMDGLFAWYDGANNQNGSQDKKATVWKDATGGGHDFEVELNDTNYWTDNAFHLDSVRNYLPDEIVDLVNGDHYTVEFAAGDMEFPATDWVSLLISDNDHFSLFIRMSNDNLEYKYNDANKDRPMADDGQELVRNSTVAITFDIDEQECDMYVDGVLVSENIPLETNIADTLMLGHEDERRIWNGDVYAMRFYNRALTAAEVAQNAAADNAKYRGGAALPAAAPADNAAAETPASAVSGFKKVADAAAAVGMTPITGYEWEDGTNGFGGEGPENLWDGDTATKFCTNEFPAESVASLDGTYKVTGFTMATANDNADYNGRSPNAWTISVSADGENWTELAKGDDSFFEEKNFTYYNGEGTAEGVAFVKFEAEGTASGTFQVSEVTLYGEKTGDKPVKEEPAPEPEPEPEPEPTVEEVAENAAEEAVENAAEAAGEAVNNAAEAAGGAVDNAKSGCGSFIGGGLIVLVTVLGSAWAAKRR